MFGVSLRRCMAACAIMLLCSTLHAAAAAAEEGASFGLHHSVALSLPLALWTILSAVIIPINSVQAQIMGDYTDPVSFPMQATIDSSAVTNVKFMIRLHAMPAASITCTVGMRAMDGTQPADIGGITPSSFSAPNPGTYPLDTEITYLPDATPLPSTVITVACPGYTDLTIPVNFVVDAFGAFPFGADAAYVTPPIWGGGNQSALPGYRNGAMGQALFNHMAQAVMRPSGDALLIADAGNNVIRRVNFATETVDTYWGPTPMSTLPYMPAAARTSIPAAPYSFESVITASSFNMPFGLALSGDGERLFVGDMYNCRVLLIQHTAGVPASLLQISGGTGCAGTTIVEGDGDTGASYLPYPGSMVFDSMRDALYVLVNAHQAGSSTLGCTLMVIDMTSTSYPANVLTATTRSGFATAPYQYDTVVAPSTPAMGYIPTLASLALSNDASALYILSAALAPVGSSPASPAPAVLRILNLAEGNTLNTILSSFYSPSVAVFGHVKDGIPLSGVEHTLPLMGGPSAAALHPDGELLYFIDSGMRVDSTWTIQPMLCNVPSVNGSEYEYVDCDSSIRSLNLLTGEVKTLAGGLATNSDGTGSKAGLWSGNRDGRNMRGESMPTRNSLLMHPDGQSMFVMEGTDHSRLRQFFFASNELRTISGGGGPGGVLSANAPARIFGNRDGYGPDALYSSPYSLDMNKPDGRYLWVADSLGVSRIDTATSYSQRVHTYTQAAARAEPASVDPSTVKIRALFPIASVANRPDVLYGWQKDNSGALKLYRVDATNLTNGGATPVLQSFGDHMDTVFLLDLECRATAMVHRPGTENATGPGEMLVALSGDDPFMPGPYWALVRLFFNDHFQYTTLDPLTTPVTGGEDLVSSMAFDNTGTFLYTLNAVSKIIRQYDIAFYDSWGWTFTEIVPAVISGAYLDNRMYDGLTDAPVGLGLEANVHFQMEQRAAGSQFYSGESYTPTSILSTAALHGQHQLVVSADGNALYFTDMNRAGQTFVRQITPETPGIWGTKNTVKTLAGGGGSISPLSVATTNAFDLRVYNRSYSSTMSWTAGFGVLAGITGGRGLAIHPVTDMMFVADYFNHNIRAVLPLGLGTVNHAPIVWACRPPVALADPVTTTAVTLIGQNFNNIGTVHVQIVNDTGATVLQVTSGSKTLTTLIFTFPNTAGGVAANVRYRFRLVYYGTFQSPTSSASFMLVAPDSPSAPQIHSVSPARSVTSALPGTLTLHGANFGRLPTDIISVHFYDTSTYSNAGISVNSFARIDENRILVSITATIAAPYTIWFQVTLVTTLRARNANVSFTAEPPLPVITAVSPMQTFQRPGSVTRITITGTDFGSQASDIAVVFASNGGASWSGVSFEQRCWNVKFVEQPFFNRTVLTCQLPATLPVASYPTLRSYNVKVTVCGTSSAVWPGFLVWPTGSAPSNAPFYKQVAASAVSSMQAASRLPTGWVVQSENLSPAFSPNTPWLNLATPQSLSLNDASNFAPLGGFGLTGSALTSLASIADQPMPSVFGGPAFAFTMAFSVNIRNPLFGTEGITGTSARLIACRKAGTTGSVAVDEIAVVYDNDCNGSGYMCFQLEMRVNGSDSTVRAWGPVKTPELYGDRPVHYALTVSRAGVVRWWINGVSQSPVSVGTSEQVRFGTNLASRDLLLALTTRTCRLGADDDPANLPTITGAVGQLRFWPRELVSTELLALASHLDQRPIEHVNTGGCGDTSSSHSSLPSSILFNQTSASIYVHLNATFVATMDLRSIDVQAFALFPNKLGTSQLCDSVSAISDTCFVCSFKPADYPKWTPLQVLMHAGNTVWNTNNPDETVVLSNGATPAALIASEAVAVWSITAPCSIVASVTHPDFNVSGTAGMLTFIARLNSTLLLTDPLHNQGAVGGQAVLPSRIFDSSYHSGFSVFMWVQLLSTVENQLLLELWNATSGSANEMNGFTVRVVTSYDQRVWALSPTNNIATAASSSHARLKRNQRMALLFQTWVAGVAVCSATSPNLNLGQWISVAYSHSINGRVALRMNGANVFVSNDVEHPATKPALCPVMPSSLKTDTARFGSPSPTITPPTAASLPGHRFQSFQGRLAHLSFYTRPMEQHRPRLFPFNATSVFSEMQHVAMFVPGSLPQLDWPESAGGQTAVMAGIPRVHPSFRSAINFDVALFPPQAPLQQDWSFKGLSSANGALIGWKHIGSVLASVPNSTWYSLDHDVASRTGDSSFRSLDSWAPTLKTTLFTLPEVSPLAGMVRILTNHTSRPFTSHRCSSILPYSFLMAERTPISVLRHTQDVGGNGISARAQCMTYISSLSGSQRVNAVSSSLMLDVQGVVPSPLHTVGHYLLFNPTTTLPTDATSFVDLVGASGDPLLGSSTSFDFSLTQSAFSFSAWFAVDDATASPLQDYDSVLHPTCIVALGSPDGMSDIVLGQSKRPSDYTSNLHFRVYSNGALVCSIDAYGVLELWTPVPIQHIVASASLDTGCNLYQNGVLLGSDPLLSFDFSVPRSYARLGNCGVNFLGGGLTSMYSFFGKFFSFGWWPNHALNEHDALLLAQVAPPNTRMDLAVGIVEPLALLHMTATTLYTLEAPTYTAGYASADFCLFAGGCARLDGVSGHFVDLSGEPTYILSTWETGFYNHPYSAYTNETGGGSPNQNILSSILAPTSGFTGNFSTSIYFRLDHTANLFNKYTLWEITNPGGGQIFLIYDGIAYSPITGLGGVLIFQLSEMGPCRVFTDATTPIMLNRWYSVVTTHFTMADGDSYLRIFIDGVLAGSMLSACTTPAAVTRSLKSLGQPTQTAPAGISSGEWFGYLSHFALYEFRVLEASEILHHARPVLPGTQRIDTVTPSSAPLGVATNVTLSVSSGSSIFCDPADIESVSYAPNAAGGVSFCKHVVMISDHSLNCEIGNDVGWQASVYFTVRMRKSIGGPTQAAKEFHDSLLGGVPGGAGLGSTNSTLTFKLGSYPANFSVIRPPADLVMLRMAQLAPDGVSTVPQPWHWQGGFYSGDGLGYTPSFGRDSHSYSAIFPWITKALGVRAQFHTPGTMSLFRNGQLVGSLVSNQTVAVELARPPPSSNIAKITELSFYHSVEGWYNFSVSRRAQDVAQLNYQFFDEFGSLVPAETVSVVRTIPYFRNATFDWPVMVPRAVRSVAIGIRYLSDHQPILQVVNGSDGSGAVIHPQFFLPPALAGFTFSDSFPLSQYPDGVQFRFNDSLDGIYTMGLSYMPAHVSSIAVVCSPSSDAQLAFDTPQLYRDPEVVFTTPVLHNGSLFTRNVSVTTNYYRPVIGLRVVFDTFLSLGSPWTDLAALNFTFLGPNEFNDTFLLPFSNVSSEGNSSVEIGTTTLRLVSWFDGVFYIKLTRRNFNILTISAFPTSTSFTEPSDPFLSRANALMGVGAVSVMPSTYPFGVGFFVETRFYNFTELSTQILPYTYSRFALSHTMRFTSPAILAFPTMLDVEGFSDGIPQSPVSQSLPYRLMGLANTTRIVGNMTVTTVHFQSVNDGYFTMLVGRSLPDVTSIQWFNARVGFLTSANSQADSSYFTYGLTNADPLVIRVPFLVRNVSFNAVWNTAGSVVLACVNRLHCSWTTSAAATQAIGSNLVHKGFSSGVTSATVFNLTTSNFSSSAHTPQQFELHNLISIYAQRDGVYNFAFCRAGADVRDVVFDFLRRDGARFTIVATSLVDGWTPKPFAGNDEIFAYALSSQITSAVIAVSVRVSYCTAFTNVSASFPDSNTTLAQPLAISSGGGGAPMWSTASPFVNLVPGWNRVEVRSDLDGIYSFMLNLTSPALVGPLQLDAEIAAGYAAPTPLDVAYNLQADPRRFPQPFALVQYPELISTRPVYLAFFHARLAWIVNGFSAGVVLEGPGMGVSRTLSPQVSSPMLDLAVGSNAFWINSSADAASYPFIVWRQEPLIARFDLGGTAALWGGASDVDPTGLVPASLSPFTNLLTNVQWNSTVYERVFFVRYSTHSVHINLTWNAWAHDPTAAAFETLSFQHPAGPVVSIPVSGSGARLQNLRTAGVGSHPMLLNSSTSDGAYNVLVIKKRLDLQDVSIATSVSPNASVPQFNYSVAPLVPAFVVGDFASWTVYVANITLPYELTNRTYAYFRVNFSTSASISASFGPTANPEMMQHRPNVSDEQAVDGRAAAFEAALNSGASAASLAASYSALAGSPTSAFSYFSTVGLGPLQGTGMTAPYILRVNSSEDGDGYELRLYVTILPQVIPPPIGFFNATRNFTAMYPGENNTVTVLISRPPQTLQGLTLVATISNSSAVLTTVPLAFGALGWSNTSNNASFALSPTWAPQTLTISFAIVRANLTNELDIAMSPDRDLYSFVAPPSFTVPVLSYPAFSWGGYPAKPCLCNPNPLSGSCSEGLFGTGVCACSSAFNGSTCSVCSTTIPRTGVNCVPLSGYFNVSRGNLSTIYTGEVSSPITVTISRAPLTPNGLRLRVAVSTVGTGAVLSVSEVLFGSYFWTNTTLNATFSVTGPSPAPQQISISFAVVRANVTAVPGSPDFDLYSFAAPQPFTLQILPYPALSWGGWPARPCTCNTNPLSGSCSQGPLGTGFCNCTTAFNGTTCSTCSSVGGPRAGPDCVSCPTCYNGGVCTPGVLSTPVCVCPGNLAGAMCDSCSVPNFFGPQCLTPCPACVVGNGACSAGTNGTGLCVCNTGWTGLTCEFISGAGLVAISSSWYGVDGGIVPIEIKLNASTPLFSARVLALPTVGRLFQTVDGRTATAAIISVPAPVTNAQLRLLYFPPTTPSVITQLADRTVSQDFFTFDVASSLYSYTSSPARVDLFLLHNNEAPVLTLTTWPSGAVRPESDTLTVVRMQQGGRLTFRALDATSNLPTVSLRGSDVDSTTNDMLLQMQVTTGVLAFDRSLLVGATVPAALAIDNILANTSIVPLLSVPSATYAIRAPLTVLNDLLSIVTFVPAPSFSGSVTLTLLLGDEGYWSARTLGLQRESTPLTVARVLPIEVNQVNQPISIVNATARFRLRDDLGNVTVYPAATPIPDFLLAGTPSVMLSAGLVDPDAYSGFVTVLLRVGAVGSSIRLANLPAAGPTSSAYSQLFVSFTIGTGYAGVKLPTASAAGPPERTLEFSAPLSKLNLLLSAVIYTPAPNSFGTDTWEVLVSDNGNTCGLVTATNPCIVNTDAYNLGFTIPRREYAPAVADKTVTVLEGSSRSTLTLTATDQNAGSLPLTMANVTTEFFLSQLIVRNLTGTTKLSWGVLGKLYQWAPAGVGAAILPGAQGTLITDVSSRVLLKLAPYFFGPGLLSFTFTARKRVDYMGNITYLSAVRNATISMQITHVNHIPYVSNGTMSTLALAAQPSLGTLYIQTEFFASGQQNLVSLKGSDLDVIDEPALRFVVEEVPKKGELYQLNDTAYDLVLLGAAGTASANFSVRGARITGGGSAVSSRRRAVVYVGPIDDPEILAAQLQASLNPESFNGLVFPMYSNFSYRVVDPYGLISNPTATIGLRLSLPVIPLLEPLNITANQDRDVALAFQPLNSQSYSLNFSAVVIHSLPTRGNLWTRDVKVTDPFDSGRGVLVDRVPFRVSALDPINGASFIALIYQPPFGQYGQDFDQLEYSVISSRGVESLNSERVTISLLKINHPPLADRLSYVGLTHGLEVMVNPPNLLNLTGSDSDGDALTAIIRSLPTQGRLEQVLANGDASGVVISTVPALVTDSAMRVKYFPNDSVSTSPYFDVFAYSMNDGAISSAAVAVSLLVHATSIPPTPTSQTVAVPEIDPVGVVVSLEGVDPKNGGSLTFFVTTMPSVGTLTQLSGSAVVPGLNIVSRNPVTGGRQLLYIPPSTRGFGVAFDSFEFGVRDSQGLASSVSATVTVDVTHTYQAAAIFGPLVRRYTVDQDTTLNPILLNVTQYDAPQRAVAILTLPAKAGRLFACDALAFNGVGVEITAAMLPFIAYTCSAAGATGPVSVFYSPAPRVYSDLTTDDGVLESFRWSAYDNTTFASLYIAPTTPMDSDQQLASDRLVAASPPIATLNLKVSLVNSPPESYGSSYTAALNTPQILQCAGADVRNSRTVHAFVYTMPANGLLFQIDDARPAEIGAPILLSGDRITSASGRVRFQPNFAWSGNDTVTFFVVTSLATTLQPGEVDLAADSNVAYSPFHPFTSPIATLNMQVQYSSVPVLVSTIAPVEVELFQNEQSIIRLPTLRLDALVPLPSMVLSAIPALGDLYQLTDTAAMNWTALVLRESKLHMDGQISAALAVLNARRRLLVSGAFGPATALALGGQTTSATDGSVVALSNINLATFPGPSSWTYDAVASILPPVVFATSRPDAVPPTLPNSVQLRNVTFLTPGATVQRITADQLPLTISHPLNLLLYVPQLRQKGSTDEIKFSMPAAATVSSGSSLVIPVTPQTATITLNVRERYLPPSATSFTEVNVRQNEAFVLVLLGTNGNDGSTNQITAFIDSLPSGGGQLCQITATTPTTPERLAIDRPCGAKYGEPLSRGSTVGDSQLRVVYMPPLNAFGDQLEFFDYSIGGRDPGTNILYSASATVVLSVIHVNQPPSTYNMSVVLVTPEIYESASLRFGGRGVSNPVVPGAAPSTSTPRSVSVLAPQSMYTFPIDSNVTLPLLCSDPDPEDPPQALRYFVSRIRGSKGLLRSHRFTRYADGSTVLRRDEPLYDFSASGRRTLSDFSQQREIVFNPPIEIGFSGDPNRQSAASESFVAPYLTFEPWFSGGMVGSSVAEESSAFLFIDWFASDHANLNTSLATITFRADCGQNLPGLLATRSAQQQINTSSIASLSASSTQVVQLWTNDGSMCGLCPSGATCSPTGQYYPLSNDGYWRSDLFDLDGNDGNTLVYLPCTPTTACISSPFFLNSTDDACAEGFGSRLCAGCKLDFYFSDGDCKACSDTKSSLLTVLIVGLPVILVVVALFVALAKLKLTLTWISVLLDLFQIIATLKHFALGWPRDSQSMFEALGVLLVNVDLLQLECQVPAVQYAQKWSIVMLLPLVVILVVAVLSYLGALVLTGTNWAAEQNQRKLNQARLRALEVNGGAPLRLRAQLEREHSFNEIIATSFRSSHNFMLKVSIICLKTLYLTISIKAQEPLKCTRLLDGSLALDAQPSLSCEDPWYISLYPWALAATVIYAAGIPILFAWILFVARPLSTKTRSVCFGWFRCPTRFKNSWEKQAFQQHVIQKRRDAINGGQASLDNQTAVNRWINTFEGLTEDFNNESFYWQMVRCARSLSLSVVAIWMGSSPLYQATFALLVLWCSLILHLFFAPFRPRTRVNRLESVGLCATIGIIFVGLLLYSKQTQHTEFTYSWVPTALDVAIKLFIASIGVATLSMLNRHFERHGIYDAWRAKCGCGPSSAKKKQMELERQKEIEMAIVAKRSRRASVVQQNKMAMDQVIKEADLATPLFSHWFTAPAPATTIERRRNIIGWHGSVPGQSKDTELPDLAPGQGLLPTVPADMQSYLDPAVVAHQLDTRPGTTGYRLPPRPQVRIREQVPGPKEGILSLLHKQSVKNDDWQEQPGSPHAPDPSIARAAALMRSVSVAAPALASARARIPLPAPRRPAPLRDVSVDAEGIELMGLQAEGQAQPRRAGPQSSLGRMTSAGPRPPPLNPYAAPATPTAAASYFTGSAESSAFNSPVAVRAQAGPATPAHISLSVHATPAQQVALNVRDEGQEDGGDPAGFTFDSSDDDDDDDAGFPKDMMAAPPAAAAAAASAAPIHAPARPAASARPQPVMHAARSQQPPAPSAPSQSSPAAGVAPGVRGRPLLELLRSVSNTPLSNADPKSRQQMQAQRQAAAPSSAAAPSAAVSPSSAASPHSAAAGPLSPSEHRRPQAARDPSVALSPLSSPSASSRPAAPVRPAAASPPARATPLASPSARAPLPAAATPAPADLISPSRLSSAATLPTLAPRVSRAALRAAGALQSPVAAARPAAPPSSGSSAPNLSGPGAAWTG